MDNETLTERLEQVVAKYRLRISGHNPDTADNPPALLVDEDDLLLLLSGAEENLRLIEQNRALHTMVESQMLQRPSMLAGLGGLQRYHGALSGFSRMGDVYGRAKR